MLQDYLVLVSGFQMHMVLQESSTSSTILGPDGLTHLIQVVSRLIILQLVFLFAGIFI
jgi:hypothetical protein